MALSLQELSTVLTHAALYIADQKGQIPYARRVIVTVRCPGIRARADQRKIYVHPILLRPEEQLTTIEDIVDIAFRIDVTRELTGDGWWDPITAGRVA